MDDGWATVEALADDDALGASEIAERAARALPAMPPRELPDAIETLLRGHPEMAPLWRLASDILSTPDRAEGASTFLSRLANDAGAVQVVAPILPDRILTISYSSTIRDAVRVRQPRTVLCMSSEPGGEGARMSELIAPFTEAAVIDDDEAIGKVPADAVVVGADAITPTSLVNKTKTRQIAEAARDHGIPCYVVAGETKFVPEEIPADDAFQRTSLDMFAMIATPMGLLTPSEATLHAAGVELHDALRKLVDLLDETPEGEPSE
jgi:translation initiation factor 2B subunit (eIF-2B alpha/beta/delta family)